MPKEIHLTTPIKTEDISELRAGDRILLSGTIFTARDTAHKRIVASLDKNEKLPFELAGSVIYYAGPAPAPPGKPIGSIGPTTSYRMDAYAPRLIEHGLKIMIGKGLRNKEVKDAIVKHQAIYCAAWGGAGALLASRIIAATCIAYEELGPEAVYKLEVKDFPVMVVNDTKGHDAYELYGGIK
ncbi:Fe-S-containing hydro-lyase [Clostridia bacterium]|nr:Fe-S-containing hydro-lyase [Clostridia bacterium]